MFTKIELQNANRVLNSRLLKDIVAKNSNRLKVLEDFFTENAVPYKTISLKGHKHCIVRFAKNVYDKTQNTKILIAHYDRCGNDFAANDNSAACVQLAFFACELKNAVEPHNIQIIFTDGEELNKTSLSNQGAFLLGLGLRELDKSENIAFFVFDMCGRGDCLIFSQSGILLRDKLKTQKLRSFHRLTVQYAKNACLPYFILPTSFSDNAGLLASGSNAQLITILPKLEAEKFYNGLVNLQKNLSFEKFAQIIKCGVIEGNEQINLNSIKPTTWKFMHTENDTIESLNVEAFALMEKYLTEIKNSKIPIG